MDGEAVMLASSISSLLKNANWTVSESQSVWFPMPQKVIILTSDQTESEFKPQLMAVAKAFSTSKIPIVVNLKSKVKKPQIVIGANTP